MTRTARTSRTLPARALAAALAALLAALVLPLGVAVLAGTATTAEASAYRTAGPSTLAWRAQAPSTVVVGRSVGGRLIVARRMGPADAPEVLLVLGQMHGSEPAGRTVVGKLRRMAPPPGVQVWSISTMNPDGAARGTRQNAHRVDLNRNFPQGWRHSYSSRIYYPGPWALSEPESQAMLRFLNRLRPDLVVSLHQAANGVDVGNAKTRLWSYRLATAFHLPTKTISCSGPCAGTLTGWYNAYYSGYAVTVELPRHVSQGMAALYAKGALTVAAMLAPRTASPTPSESSTSPTPTDTPTATPTDTPSPGGTVGAGLAP